MDRIRPEEARRLEGAVFVDSRSSTAWARSDEQIPGSIRIAPDSVDESRLEVLPKGRPIVCYCT